MKNDFLVSKLTEAYGPEYCLLDVKAFMEELLATLPREVEQSDVPVAGIRSEDGEILRGSAWHFTMPYPKAAEDIKADGYKPEDVVDAAAQVFFESEPEEPGFRISMLLALVLDEDPVFAAKFEGAQNAGQKPFVVFDFHPDGIAPEVFRMNPPTY